MLRRQPTKITLVQDDIAAYDARKARKDVEKSQQAYKSFTDSRKFSSFQPMSSDMDPTGAASRDARSTEQRIGLGNSRN